MFLWWVEFKNAMEIFCQIFIVWLIINISSPYFFFFTTGVRHLHKHSFTLLLLSNKWNRQIWSQTLNFFVIANSKNCPPSNFFPWYEHYILAYIKLFIITIWMVKHSIFILFVSIAFATLWFFCWSPFSWFLVHPSTQFCQQASPQAEDQNWKDTARIKIKIHYNTKKSKLTLYNHLQIHQNCGYCWDKISKHKHSQALLMCKEWLSFQGNSHLDLIAYHF